MCVCVNQIIESRERSDPASGEISDGAIIVSHLVSQVLLLTAITPIQVVLFSVYISCLCAYVCLWLSNRIWWIWLEPREQVRLEQRVRADL